MIIVCRLLPAQVQHLYPQKNYFSLNNPVSLKLCNYNRFLKELDNEGIRAIAQTPCKCAEHKEFTNNYYKHVFTGDLKFIGNQDIRNLLNLGTKHRLPEPHSNKELLNAIGSALDKHINRESKTLKIDASDFEDWRSRIMTLARARLYKNTEHCIHNSKNAREEDNYDERYFSNDYIKYIHRHFIIAPVDKASCNFAFICKKFYVEILLKELGFDLTSFAPTGNVTYTPIDDEVNGVISKHKDVMKEKFQTRCTDTNLRVPKIYWLPKLHKSPYKFRFIAGAKNCTTKQLSVKLNKGLKVVREHFKRYCEAIYKNSGINVYWSINSTDEFLSKIRNLKMHNVQVFDFSTLYTNLDQSDILKHINSLLDLIFNNSNRKYMCIGFDKTFLSGIKYAGYSVYDKKSFKAAIEFVVNEVYVTFAGHVFRQTKGIPMGGNCSPLLADLFLSHCELIYMTDLIKDKKTGLARLLSNTSRYIDDICIINYTSFGSRIPLIYPDSLEASRSGHDDKCAEYLDVKLEISKDGLKTSVYHKVDDFNFPVTLLTFPDNTIPHKMGAQVFASQVLRYGRICTHELDFINKVRNTFQLLVARGYSRFELKQSAQRQLQKHWEVILKFGYYSAKQMLDNHLF